MMNSEGKTDIGAQLETRRDDWELVAAASLIQGLLRIFSSGNMPAEVHVDPSKLDQVRALTLSDKVDRLAANDPNERNIRIVAEWWDGNREQLHFMPRDGVLHPYVISVAEQAEATVFAAVFQQLQMKGLDKALMQLGLDLQTLTRSPKLFQDTVWFQFQLMLHERMKSVIVTPQEMPIFRA